MRALVEAFQQEQVRSKSYNYHQILALRRPGEGLARGELRRGRMGSLETTGALNRFSNTHLFDLHQRLVPIPAKNLLST